MFFDLIPTAWPAVLDGDAVLLGRIDVPDRELWATPDGMVDGRGGAGRIGR